MTESTIDERLLALAAGELHGRVLRRRLNTGGDATRSERLVRMVDDLATFGSWGENENEAIRDLVRLVSEGGSTQENRSESLSSIRDRLVDDPAASPTAVAIACIAVNSAVAQGQMATYDEVLVHDVEGAIEGAVLGAEIPLPGTTLLGAILVGGLSSAVAAAG